MRLVTAESAAFMTVEMVLVADEDGTGREVVEATITGNARISKVVAA